MLRGQRVPKDIPILEMLLYRIDIHDLTLSEKENRLTRQMS
jgi:hypothetical protein